jgi:hypothetical protein
MAKRQRGAKQIGSQEFFSSEQQMWKSKGKRAKITLFLVYNLQSGGTKKERMLIYSNHVDY